MRMNHLVIFTLALILQTSLNASDLKGDDHVNRLPRDFMHQYRKITQIEYHQEFYEEKMGAKFRDFLGTMSEKSQEEFWNLLNSYSLEEVNGQKSKSSAVDASAAVTSLASDFMKFTEFALEGYMLRILRGTHMEVVNNLHKNVNDSFSNQYEKEIDEEMDWISFKKYHYYFWNNNFEKVKKDAAIPLTRIIPDPYAEKIKNCPLHLVIEKLEINFFEGNDEMSLEELKNIITGEPLDTYTAWENPALKDGVQ